MLDNSAFVAYCINTKHNKRQGAEMAFMTVDQNSPVPLYTQIAEQIQKMISNGELNAGAPLPSIRLVASQLEIAVNTVARAYRDLEDAGIVESNGRKGSFIRRDYSPGLETNPFNGQIKKCRDAGMSKEEIKNLFDIAFNSICKE